MTATLRSPAQLGGRVRSIFRGAGLKKHAIACRSCTRVRRVRIEQLLAVDLVVRDHALALG